MRSHLLLGLTVSALLTGCGLDFQGGPTVVGSGVLKSENRPVGNFKELELGGATKAIVTVGPKASLKIEADDNLLKLIRTEVKGDRLTVEMEGNTSSRSGVKLWITVPDLRTVDISGANDVEITGLKGKDFVAEISGASELLAKGKVEKIALEVSGASEVDFTQLLATKAVIEASGASTIKSAVSDEISGDLSGASRIINKGQPKKQNVATSGASSFDIEH